MREAQTGQLVDAIETEFSEITALEDPYADMIADEIQTETISAIRERFVTLTRAVETLQSAIRASDVDNVYADGLSDGFGQFKGNLSHVGGQFGSARKVIDAGARGHKAAEYVENARDSLKDTADRIGSPETSELGFVSFVSKRKEETDSEEVIRACNDVIYAAMDFRGSVRVLQAECNKAIDRLTD